MGPKMFGMQSTHHDIYDADQLPSSKSIIPGDIVCNQTLHMGQIYVHSGASRERHMPVVIVLEHLFEIEVSPSGIVVSRMRYQASYEEAYGL